MSDFKAKRHQIRFWPISAAQFQWNCIRTRPVVFSS